MSLKITNMVTKINHHLRDQFVLENVYVQDV